VVKVEFEFFVVIEVNVVILIVCETRLVIVPVIIVLTGGRYFMKEVQKLLPTCDGELISSLVWEY